MPPALELLEAAHAADKPFALVLADVHMPHADGFSLVVQMKQRPGLARATVMMLTSGGQPGDVGRCRELGIAQYLTKPVKQSDLLDAIVLAVRSPSSSSEGVRAEGVRAEGVRAEGVRGQGSGVSKDRKTDGPASARTPDPSPLTPSDRTALRILLAEDNLVNQMLVVMRLQQRGDEVVVANNGKEALAAWEAERFDVVLMDVQMPEMGGFEATAAIRARERDSGRHTPIIAMTAHALKGDRERCLEAGMDDYLSKPLRGRTVPLVGNGQLVLVGRGQGRRGQGRRGQGRRGQGSGVRGQQRQKDRRPCFCPDP